MSIKKCSLFLLHEKSQYYFAFLLKFATIQKVEVRLKQIMSTKEQIIIIIDQIPE